MEAEPLRPRLTELKDCSDRRMLFLKRDQYITRSLDLYGEFSELEARAFDQLLRANDVVVEAGANIGAHTVHIAKLVGARELVLAFELQRVIHELLCANVALNELFHVRPYRAALGRDVGNIKVPIVDYAGEINFGGISLSQSSAGEDVPLLALDSIALPSLRMLKVDVEGMEAEVLSGARQTITKLRPILYVENDRRGHSEGLIRLIEELGYNMLWHQPRLFNPGNFANIQQNVFGGIVSINLLCFPKEMPTDVSGLRPVAGPRGLGLTRLAAVTLRRRRSRVEFQVQRKQNRQALGLALLDRGRDMDRRDQELIAAFHQDRRAGIAARRIAIVAQEPGAHREHGAPLMLGQDVRPVLAVTGMNEPGAHGDPIDLLAGHQRQDTHDSSDVAIEREDGPVVPEAGRRCRQNRVIII